MKHYPPSLTIKTNLLLIQKLDANRTIKMKYILIRLDKNLLIIKQVSLKQEKQVSLKLQFGTIHQIEKQFTFIDKKKYKL